MCVERTTIEKEGEVYGKELILDLGSCDVTFFNRRSLGRFLTLLCKELEMEACERYWWDYGSKRQRELAPAHLAGISVVQFIKTSNITIHTIDKMNKVFLNVFSCKDFDSRKTMDFCSSYFHGKVLHVTEVIRV